MAQLRAGGDEPPAGWAGLLADLGVFRPLDSRFTIYHNHVGPPVGTFNLTGIHASATAAYLFQEGQFVVGPRATLKGGLIESMPLDYVVRTNAILTFGGEAGIARGLWYVYGFGAGGAAWVSAEKRGMGKSDNTVSAYEIGAGARYRLPKNWYAKAELSYVTLGDQWSGAYYFEPKSFIALTAGFGVQFTSN